MKTIYKCIAAITVLATLVLEIVLKMCLFPSSIFIFTIASIIGGKYFDKEGTFACISSYGLRYLNTKYYYITTLVSNHFY